MILRYLLLRWPSLLFIVGLVSHLPVIAAEIVANPSNVREKLAMVRAGDTLVLRAGVYRETLDIRNKKGTEERPIVIRSESPGARAILKGSDLLVGWDDLGAGLYGHALGVQPSMVFVDGKRLAQMGGTIFNGYPILGGTGYEELHVSDGGVWPGRVSKFDKNNLPLNSFYYDFSARRLLVRASVDLNNVGRVVEVTQRERVFFAENVQYLTVADVDVMHANTSVTNRGGAMTMLGQHITVKGVRAYYNDLVGIQVDGDSNRIEDSVSTYNGQMGVAARGSSNLLLRVEASYNNTRGFNTWWEAGGFKFVSEDGGLRNSKLIDCRATFNQGDGIWFDWKNKGNLISRSMSAYNSGFGIHYEASSDATIEDNYIFGNGLRGIYLPHSRANLVMHNLVMANSLEGVAAVTEGRKDNEGRPFLVDDNVFVANIIAWNGSGALIVPSDSRARSDGNLFFGTGLSQRFSVGWSTVFNLPVHGVDEWRKRAGVDLHSRSLREGMPVAIKAMVDARSTDRSKLTNWLDAVRRDALSLPVNWSMPNLSAADRVYEPGPRY
jgi:parallel beta-helix repeat protein